MLKEINITSYSRIEDIPEGKGPYKGLIKTTCQRCEVTMWTERKPERCLNCGEKLEKNAKQSL